MSHLIEIWCTWLLKKTLVISINLKILLMVKALKYSMKFFVSRMILLMNVDRSNRPEVFCKKSILRNLAKLTGKHLYQSHSNFIKKRLWCRCFPVNFVKFLRTTFFIKHLWCLLLYRQRSCFHIASVIVVLSGILKATILNLHLGMNVLL